MYLVPAPSHPRSASVATPQAEPQRWGGERSSRAGGALIATWLLIALGCGSSASDGAFEEPLACTTSDDCDVGRACEAGACVEHVVVVTRAAGPLACSVMSCPAGTGDCCSTAAASATGNRRQEYASYLHMVRDADSSDGQVRADFWFDAPNQQGWLTFRLAEEMDLSHLSFYGWREGVADRFLSVNTNQSEGGGCAYGFELEFRPNPDPSPSGAPFVLGTDVSFDTDDFCYDGGRPGRASELAFAVFSTQPGPASLVISNIQLSSE